MAVGRGMRILGAVTSAAVLVGAALTGAPEARADDPTPVVVEQQFTTADGVELRTTLTSPGPVEARPTVVEFSPYGNNSQSFTFDADYNYLLVQIRGTGSSDGQFDALGPRTQQDVVEVLDWACTQPFSDGRLAVAGFSASAIMLFNSWHLHLPCVEAAVTRSGTHELYRDLLVPGGVQNLIPGAGVLALIGAPLLMQGGDRVTDPQSAYEAFAGMFTTGVNAGLAHPSLDAWWRDRGWRGDANDIPVLLIDGFFDVESRGAFQAYQALKGDGAHLLLAGGHDGSPAGTDGGAAEAQAWLDHFLLGSANGVETHPRVQLLMSQGDRTRYLAGDFVRRDGTDWPLPGTSWVPLHLGGRGLSLTKPALATTQRYATVPSIPTMTDVPNAALIGAAGLDMLTGALPLLTQTQLADLTGLTYTTRALATSVDLAGPVALELPLKTSTPNSSIWAVLSDVAPDGSSHPLTVGRLSTSYPGVVASQSLVDGGNVVQPYGDYSTKQAAKPGQWRTYQVELWPVGNRFLAGHKIRLTLAGSSLASLPTGQPAIHTVRVGGPAGARILVPVLPGSTLSFG
ncbi:CocE/NonD family hydrolase [Nocardioides humilatus]|uniref:CocE/NonD family hydrolase n=1 Tax=Nocardioides humilatus TaxID=2607660 RepID=A0A5B1LF65_9ACTN|nr:CocE/NonD family hydrolase [Nocardioides humilatus]KAA1419391.1 CocE/NonD family hydrolase [Nocardioides humilatus]